MRFTYDQGPVLLQHLHARVEKHMREQLSHLVRTLLILLEDEAVCPTTTGGLDHAVYGCASEPI